MTPPAAGKKGGAPQTQAPKSSEEKDTAPWKEVVSRKEKRIRTAAAAVKETAAASTNTKRGKETAVANPPQMKTNGQEPAKKKRREPRTAAVTLTCPPGTYEKNLREARQTIEVKGLNIEGTLIKRGITGSYIFEISGANKHEKADKFALGMREALKGKMGVRVQRPTKMAEMRLRGMLDFGRPRFADVEVMNSRRRREKRDITFPLRRRH